MIAGTVKTIGVADVKVGERLTIENDGYGNRVRQFDRKRRKYTDELQTWEVTSVEDGCIKLKPVWKDEE